MCFRLWPFNLSFLSFLFFDWVGVLWPQLSKVSKPVRWASSVPFPPAVAGRQIVIVRVAAYASDSGESLHCFLVGANKSYVIATSDLWLFLHASNLLPLLPIFFFFVALRPRKWGGLLGTGTWGEGDERVKARPRIPPERDRRDHGPPPEQWKC